MWVSRKTPFGIARYQEKPIADPVTAEDRYPGMKAFASGDMIRFERPGPFGVYRWERRKTELNAMEQAAWDRATHAAGQD